MPSAADPDPRLELALAPGDHAGDLVGGLAGGLGMVPGANIGDSCAVFEAVHGTAPDIAGKNVANPAAMLLSAAMMLDYLGEGLAAARVRSALTRVLAAGRSLTPDLGGSATTAAMTDAILAEL